MNDPNMMAALNGEPEPQQQSKQPQQQGQQSSPMQDALLGWIKTAYSVGALSPTSIRGPFSKAQEAYAGMVNKTLGKQFDEAIKDRYAWEQHTSVALDLNRRRLQEYSAAFSGETPMEEKMQKVSEVASRWGDNSLAKMVASPEQFPTFGRILDQMNTQQQGLEQATQTLDVQIKQIEQQYAEHQQKQGGGKGGGNGNGNGNGGMSDLPPIESYLQDKPNMGSSPVDAFGSVPPNITRDRQMLDNFGLKSAPTPGTPEWSDWYNDLLRSKKSGPTDIPMS